MYPDSAALEQISSHLQEGRRAREGVMAVFLHLCNLIQMKVGVGWKLTVLHASGLQMA